jgi:hypothetical protein
MLRFLIMAEISIKVKIFICTKNKILIGLLRSLSEQGRGYGDIKKELEEFQKVIVDETGKYTDKEKDEANIKYEKVNSFPFLPFVSLPSNISFRLSPNCHKRNNLKPNWRNN